MLFHNRAYRSQAPNIPGLSSYCADVRAAHALADMLKRTRPHLCEYICELQATISRCQTTLDEEKARIEQVMAKDGRPLSPPCTEVISALRELDSTIQVLLDLRHKGQMARS